MTVSKHWEACILCPDWTVHTLAYIKILIGNPYKMDAVQPLYTVMLLLQPMHVPRSLELVQAMFLVFLHGCWAKEESLITYLSNDQ